MANLVAAADSGNPDATAEADRICAGIAGAVQVLVLAYGSAIVALGGGVIHHGVGLVPRVRALLAAKAAESEFIGSLGLADRLTVIPADYPVSAIGAGLVGLTRSRDRELIRAVGQPPEASDSAAVMSSSPSSVESSQP